MSSSRVNAVDVVLVALAIPLWLFLQVVVSQSFGFGNNPVRHVLAPVVLGAMTVALHRLIRSNRHSWTIAALTAGATAIAAIYSAAWFASL